MGFVPGLGTISVPEGVSLSMIALALTNISSFQLLSFQLHTSGIPMFNGTLPMVGVSGSEWDLISCQNETLPERSINPNLQL